MNKARTDLAELTRSESFELLSAKTIGRLIYTTDALPAVQPVRYVVDDETIVFRTSEAKSIVGTGDDAVVAFEVDELDADTGIGWVVTVVGSASILDRAEAERYCPRALRPLSSDEVAGGHVVAVIAGIVTGRRVTG